MPHPLNALEGLDAALEDALEETGLTATGLEGALAEALGLEETTGLIPTIFGFMARMQLASAGFAPSTTDANASSAVESPSERAFFTKT